MTRALAQVGLGIVILLAGCVPAYEPPTVDKPHAVLKVRRTYEVKPGTRLREVVHINGHRAYVNDGGLPVGVLNDAVLVHPEGAEVELSGTFFHMDRQMVRESYQEQVPYPDQESYSCGSYDSPRTCYRSVTRYRSETKYRTVWKDVEVIDAACKRTVSLGAAEGAAYLLQFTFQGNSSCDLRCYAQTKTDGELQNDPCPPAPPKE